VQSTSIGMPGGSAREGVCIAAGVAVEGGCERRKENGVRGEQSVSSARERSEWGASGGKVEGFICEAVEI
jgi:hypothetical protein